MLFWWVRVGKCWGRGEGKRWSDGMEGLKVGGGVMFILLGIGGGRMMVSGFLKVSEGELLEGGLGVVCGVVLTGVGVKVFGREFVGE